jgi:hypothetical protein
MASMTVGTSGMRRVFRVAAGATGAAGAVDIDGLVRAEKRSPTTREQAKRGVGK